MMSFIEIANNALKATSCERRGSFWAKISDFTCFFIIFSDLIWDIIWIFFYYFVWINHFTIKIILKATIMVIL